MNQITPLTRYDIEGRIYIMKKFTCDVLVVGAGSAGVRAALAAQEKNASVILAVKGKIGKSGASTFRVTEHGGFCVADGKKDPSDNPDVHYNDIMFAGHGMCVAEDVRTLVDNAKDSFDDMEKYGVSFVKKDGKYVVTTGCFGTKSRTYQLGEHGLSIVAPLSKLLNKSTTTIIEDCMITDLIVEDNVSKGAIGIMENGDYIMIIAKTVILTSGGAGQMFKYSLNPKEMTGDSYAMGYRAGAKMANMEFMQIGCGILWPTLSILNSWIWAQHPKLTDKNGDSALTPYLPTHMKSDSIMDSKSTHYPFSSVSISRYIEIGIHKTMTNGKALEHGGVKFDAVEALKNSKESSSTLFKDMWQTTDKWYKKHNMDLENNSVEVGCFAHAINGGLVIDKNAATSIKNLYAVGEASTGTHGADRLGGNMLIQCVVFGKIAGNNAADEAKQIELPKINESHWMNLMKESSNSNSNSKTINADDFLNTLQDLNYTNLLINRSEEKCIIVEEGLKKLESELENVSYKGCSNWMQYNLRNLLLVSHLMVEAIKYRKESRGSHYREDFKEENESYNKPYFFN